MQRLKLWREETIERIRIGDPEALSVKRSLDAALRWLEIGERCHVPLDAEAVVLPAPDDYEPLGEYRILWDAETEDSRSWREVARAYPGDLLLKLR
jgi:hypothetical protein